MFSTFFTAFNLIIFIMLLKNVRTSDTNKLKPTVIHYVDPLSKYIQIEKHKNYVHSPIHDEKVGKNEKKTTVTDIKKETEEISSKEEPKNKKPIKKMESECFFHNNNMGSKTNKTGNVTVPQNISIVERSQNKEKKEKEKHVEEDGTSDKKISRNNCNALENDTKKKGIEKTVVKEKKGNDENIEVIQIKGDNKKKTYRNENEAEKTKFKLKEEIVEYKEQNEQKEMKNEQTEKKKKLWKKQNYFNEEAGEKKKIENEKKDNFDEMDAKFIFDTTKTKDKVKEQMTKNSFEEPVEIEKYNNKITSNMEASSTENEKSTIEYDVEKNEHEKKLINLIKESIGDGRKEKHLQKSLEENNKEEKYKYINNNDNLKESVANNITCVQIDEENDEMGDINKNNEDHTIKSENSSELTIEGERSLENNNIDVTESSSDNFMNADIEEKLQKSEKRIYLNYAAEAIDNRKKLHKKENEVVNDVEELEKQYIKEWPYKKNSLNASDNIRKYLDMKQKKKNAKEIIAKKILLGLFITLGFFVSSLIGFAIGRESSHIRSNAKYFLAQQKLLGLLIKNASK